MANVPGAAGPLAKFGLTYLLIGHNEGNVASPARQEQTIAAECPRRKTNRDIDTMMGRSVEAVIGPRCPIGIVRGSRKRTVNVDSHIPCPELPGLNQKSWLTLQSLARGPQ